LIFVFLGTFILAQAIFAHRLNERIAYGVLSWDFIGARPGRLLVAYGAIAAFVSMWISNTATAAMLLPLGLSLLAFMESEAKISKSYATAFMLVTAYGASIGGLATPVGTPPNIIAIGMIERFVQIRITFVQWMMIAVPIAAAIMGFVFIYLNKVGNAGVKSIPGAEQIIEARRRELGPWTRGEKNVLVAFIAMISLWIIPGVMPLVLGPSHPLTVRILSLVPEAVGAIVAALLLFFLPLNRTQRSTITWEQAAKIDWGTILLFGGGLALGELALKTKLADAVGVGLLDLLPISSVVTLTFAGAFFGVLISETMSNTAAANIAIPVIISIALAAGVNPIPPALAASLAASIAVVFPVSTPPCAIVYSSGRVPITKMVRYGLLVDLVAIIVVPAMVLLLAPLVLG
jgi:sodium-dependent dicarboxylate transporter 2/3/5